MKTKIEILTLVIQSAVTVSILYVIGFYRNQSITATIIMKTLFLISLLYSLTGAVFRFSFFGQYEGKSSKNDLMRILIVTIVLIQTMILFVMF